MCCPQCRILEKFLGVLWWGEDEHVVLLITNNVGWSVPIHLFIIGIQVYTPSLVTLCLVWFGNVWRVDLLTGWQNCLDWRSKFAILIGKVDEHDVAPGCVTEPSAPTSQTTLFIIHFYNCLHADLVHTAWEDRLMILSLLWMITASHSIQPSVMVRRHYYLYFISGDIWNVFDCSLGYFSMMVLKCG